jgi:hypothetical protein
MPETKKDSSSKRAYPGVYEKVIPIFLGIIGIAIVILVIIALLVALGVFPGSG